MRLTSSTPRKDASPEEKAAFQKKGESETIRKSARVLVVDDDPDAREAMLMLLELEGHTGKTACNGKEGLAAYSEGRYDIVISDLHMPEMNGLQMLKAIRAIDPDALVVVISGEGNDDEFTRLREAGAMKVLRKPADLDVIQKLVSSSV